MHASSARLHREGIRCVALVTLLLAATGMTARAQDVVTAPVYGEQELEEILVTGSRIVRRDYESSSPIVTVTGSLFEQSGSPSVQRMLDTLPQLAPWFAETTNNPPGPVKPGQAILDLRGMGAGRTLVLLDGRRLVPAGPSGAVDVNLIPQAIVDSVEIITGGASAVYGSDAIAGVVNFKTRRFTGLETEASWEQTHRADGIGWHAGVTGGLEFSRGYAYGHLSYDERDSVTQGHRHFSEVALEYDADLGEFFPSGSTGIRQGFWAQIGGNLPTQEAIDAYLGRVDPTYTPGAVTNRSSFGFNQDGSLFSTAPVYNFTGDRNERLQPVYPDYYTYNFAPPNYLRTPLERVNFFGKMGFEIAEGSELFLQVLGASSQAHLQLAPMPMGGAYVSPDNPFVHPDFATLLASRPDPEGLLRFGKRMNDLGPRQRNADYDALQIVAGVEGGVRTLPGWRYTAYLSWGEWDTKDETAGLVSRSAFEVLSLAPDAGASICGGDGMNPFGIGSISRGCGNFFQRDVTDSETIRQTIGEATATGPVLSVPAGEISTAVGIQYRKDKYEFEADPALAATRIDPVFGYEVFDIPGNHDAQSMQGQTDSWEFYLEARVPLLKDRSIAQLLEFDAGYRYADHSNAGSVNAWKAATIWRVTGQLTVRSSFQRAVRAPDAGTLFTPRGPGLRSLGRWGEPCEFDFEDPAGQISGAQQDAEVAALCLAQGIPAEVLPGFFDSDEIYDVLDGGNPDLEEETADTFTLGVVLRAQSDGVLAGLQASIDYYNIEIDDVIGFVENLVFPCYDRQFNPSLDPENFYCQRFQRNPVTHEITNALNTAVNAATMATAGTDFQVDYVVDAGPGQLRVNAVATHVDTAKFKAAPRVPTTEYAGLATGYVVTASSALFSLVPRWKGVIGIGYSVGGLSSNLRWRYVGSMQDGTVKDFKLSSRQYLDLTMGYAFDSGLLEGLSLRAGITNLADEQPVIYPSWVEANTAPSIYDVLGRRYFLRATYAF